VQCYGAAVEMINFGRKRVNHTPAMEWSVWYVWNVPYRHAPIVLYTFLIRADARADDL